MKKHLLFVILALVLSAAPLLAQTGTIAVYFTANGVDYSRYAQFSSFTYDAIVTIHVEDVVRGGSFQMAFDSADIAPIGESFPPNVHIGTIVGGLDIGLNSPLFGFLGAPVVLATQTFVNNVYPNVPNVNFEILPAFANLTPIYADGAAVLHPLTGMRSALGSTVANADKTWSNVKSLYR